MGQAYGRASSRIDSQRQPRQHVPPSPSHGQKKPYVKTPALTDSPSIDEIRRANLHVLTARNGTKAQLGRSLKLSQSNMAHRLHGQKRMDDAETNRVIAALGLSTDWFDQPREAGDVRENGVIAAHDTFPSTAATDLGTLRGIHPIAEALLKTLAGKARTGRLDEMKALELLHQAISL